MKVFVHLLKTVYFSVLIFLLLAKPVYAYIDPATTSYIVQIVSGILITLGIVFGVFFKRIKMFFQNLNVKRMEKKISKEAEKGRHHNGTKTYK